MRTVVVAAVTALAIAALFTVFVVPKPPEPAPVEPNAELVGRLDEIERAFAMREAEEVIRLQGRADAAALHIQAQATLIDALQKRLAATEKRITALDREARARTGPPKDTKPAAPTPADKEATEKEVNRWLERLQSDNENIAFSATLELGRLKDARAVPPLVETLNSHADFYVRLGAAAALGDIKTLNSVPALIEALKDKDALVRSAANDALNSITGRQASLSPGAAEDERRAAQDEWWNWWNDNEARLRAR